MGISLLFMVTFFIHIIPVSGYPVKAFAVDSDTRSIHRKGYTRFE